jgi:hypothetical protein
MTSSVVRFSSAMRARLAREALTIALQHSQPEHQRRQRLPGFVVQLACDGLALLFLGLHQPARHCLQACPAGADLFKQLGSMDSNRQRISRLARQVDLIRLEPSPRAGPPQVERADQLPAGGQRHRQVGVRALRGQCCIQWHSRRPIQGRIHSRPFRLPGKFRQVCDLDHLPLPKLEQPAVRGQWQERAGHEKDGTVGVYGRRPGRAGLNVEQNDRRPSAADHLPDPPQRSLGNSRRGLRRQDVLIDRLKHAQGRLAGVQLLFGVRQLRRALAHPPVELM